MKKEIHETSNLKRDLKFPYYTQQVEFEAGIYVMAVSYTHLTLPTIA